MRGVHSGMRIRRRYHASAATIVLLAFALLLAIGSINSQNNLLFLLLGLTLASGIVSGFISGHMMMSVRAERHVPHHAAAGSPAAFRYIVSNRSRWMPLFALRVEEVTWSRERKARSWERLLAAPRGYVAYVPPRGTVEIVAGTTPVRRGEARLTALRVSSAFPFGLVRKSCTFEQHAALVIHPRVLRLRPDVTSNLVSRADIGKTASSLRGRGDEFYGLRDYTPGDSPRLIAWRSSARLGSLVVRENTAPAAGQVWILLNLTGPAAAVGEGDADERRERAITLAASLIHHAASAGMEPGLALLDRGMVMAPEAGARHTLALMNALAMLDSPADSARPAREPAASVPPRAASIVVHAHSVDPTLGPAGARHVAARDLDSLVHGGGERGARAVGGSGSA